MTPTPLLPPDPEKPGRYWLKTNDGGPDVTARWEPAGYWRIEGTGKNSTPAYLAHAGYTLATRHRILTPGELEAVYAAAGQMHSQKKAAMRMCRRYVVGTVDYEQERTRASAYADAAAMLRDALGGGQE